MVTYRHQMCQGTERGGVTANTYSQLVTSTTFEFHTSLLIDMQFPIYQYWRICSHTRTHTHTHTHTRTYVPGPTVTTCHICLATVPLQAHTHTSITNPYWYKQLIPKYLGCTSQHTCKCIRWQWQCGRHRVAWVYLPNFISPKCVWDDI